MIQYYTAPDGARLAYRDEGQGLPVLALSGLTRDGRDFDYVAPHLEGIRLIRPDYRGRGASDWTGPETYTVPTEAGDVLALMDHLGLEKAAILGTSRGGLIALVLAAIARDRLLGVCFNDIGPEIPRAGLEAIAGYVGMAPPFATQDQMVTACMFGVPGFANVPESRWREEVERHTRQTETGLALPYDPALKQSFDAAMAAPEVDMWPLFDALAGLPLALIRGENSTLLTSGTAEKMRARRSDMLFADIPDRAHIPFLDEPPALDVLTRWLAMMG